MSVQSQGNLVQYGIYQEQSDYRCHVCFGEGFIYLYPTQSGIDACDSGHFRKKPAYQPDEDDPTAEGYLVPPGEITHCISAPIQPNILRQALAMIPDRCSTTRKGEVATKLVRHMLRHGKLAIPFQSLEVTDRKIQIDGTDLIINCSIRIQVKCDWRGGDHSDTSTGNLFLQVAERNPFNRH